MQEGHKDVLDPPVLVAVALQPTLDLVVEDKAVFSALQAFQMVFETLQQRRICRSVGIRQTSLLRLTGTKCPVFKEISRQTPGSQPRSGTGEVVAGEHTNGTGLQN